MDEYTIEVTYEVIWDVVWEDFYAYLMENELTEARAKRLLQVLMENKDKWPDQEPGEFDLRKTGFKDTDPELFRFLEEKYLECWRIADGAGMIRCGKDWDSEAMDRSAALKYAVEHLGYRVPSLESAESLDDDDFYPLGEEEHEEFEEFLDGFLSSTDDRELVRLNEEHGLVGYDLDEEEFLLTPLATPMEIGEVASRL